MQITVREDILIVDDFWDPKWTQQVIEYLKQLIPLD